MKVLDPDSGTRAEKRFAVTLAGAGLLMTASAGAALTQWWMVGERPGAARAIAIAAGATLPGALLGWVVARIPFTVAADGASLALAAIALRVGLPLAWLGWLSGRRTKGAGADAADLLLGAYLAVWAVDIVLQVSLGKSRSGREPRPRAEDDHGVAD